MATINVHREFQAKTLNAPSDIDLLSLSKAMFCTQDQFKHCIRISFASYRDNEKWNNGIKTLAKIIAEHCK
ncbi:MULTISPECIES: hypothetical protein [unclassified Aliivibrio]|uniref:hypothetical protein n=1 Tax=unclassified Aliivibrio TaxID=2645654 RepID=UPI00080DB751|nr:MULTISPECIES: hypothetical protein [unclassified Aliivibrio]OCH26904.1 hypothetical protein A6E06_09790 [Aliivibrio sp. 1S175]